MNKNNIGRKFLKLILNIIVVLFSFSCVFPIVWMIYSSLKTQQEFTNNIISLPIKPQFENYIKAIKTGNMEVYFLNSLYISILSVALIVVIGFITGYFLSRYSFKGRNIIYLMFLSGMLIPVHGLLIPVFVEFKWMRILDKWYTLILPYVAFGLPMAIFLIESFVKSIPIEIEEAALIDGSPITTTLMKIIMPICKPVLSTVIILTFLSTWNEFPFALVLIKSQGLKTLPVGLTNFNGQFTVEYTQLMAALSIATIPVIVIYLIFYKRIIQGMTAGAVKG